MMSRHDQNDDEHRWRSWSWVSNKTFSALPFYQRSWEILKPNWTVFVWKILADLAARMATAAVGLVLVGLFVVDFQLHSAAGGGLLGWVEKIAQTVRTPSFIAGLVGLAFFASLIGTAIQALATAGVWGVIDRGLRDEPIKKIKTFWSQALEHFPAVFSLFLLRFAIQIVTILLFAALIMGIVHASAGGLYEGAPVLLKAIVIGGALTFFLAWAGLSRLALEVIGAPMIMDNVDLGEAILRGCLFTVDNFWSLYRLLIFALGLLLIPLGLYWMLIMVNNLTLIWPQLAPLGTMLRLFGELILWMSISAIGVAFYGAVFAFYGHDDDAYDPSEATDDRAGSEESQGSPLFQKGATIDDFLPDETPNRVDIDEIFPDSQRQTDDESSEEPVDDAEDISESPDASDSDSQHDGPAEDRGDDEDEDLDEG